MRSSTLPGMFLHPYHTNFGSWRGDGGRAGKGVYPPQRIFFSAAAVRYVRRSELDAIQPRGVDRGEVQSVLFLFFSELSSQTG